MGRNHVLTVPQIKQAAAMYQRGMSRREVAAEFGVSEDAVKNGLAAIGVRLRGRLQGLHLAVVKRAAVKPPHYEVGTWQWLNAANADQWKTRTIHE